MPFDRGHALLIGVGSYQSVSSMDVPITAADARALAVVLGDPQQCGYPEAQVTLLHDAMATREGILDALDALARRTGPDDTVMFFYCGHGDYGDDGTYYLTTYDTRIVNKRVVGGTGVSQQELLAKITALTARRMLLIFNACHAGAVVPTLSSEGVASGQMLPEATAAALLATGEGRIVITACREGQFSYIGDGDLTIFTQVLVDGLSGTGVTNQRGYISAFDLYTVLYDNVSATVHSLYQRQQEPELTIHKGVGPFAVALFRGVPAQSDFDTQARLEPYTAVREVSLDQSRRLYAQIQIGGVNFGQATTNVIDGDVVGHDKVSLSGNFQGATVTINDPFATPSESPAKPAWDRRGVPWLAAGAVGAVLLVGLIHLLLYDWPTLLATASVMTGVLMLIFGMLGLRDDQAALRRLSRTLARSAPVRVGAVVLLAGALLGWGLIGVPTVQAIAGGPLGLRPRGVQRVAIGEFTNLTPEATVYGPQWTLGTRDAIYQKLSRVPTLQMIDTSSPQVTEQIKRELDVWITGRFQKSEKAELIANLSGRGGKYLTSVTQAAWFETPETISATQTALALDILRQLRIEVTSTLSETIRRTPTGDPDALDLNNTGVDLTGAKRYAEAEAKYRAALAIDPEYSAAYANLAVALANQGQYDAAIDNYRNAIARLPNYPVFHYNLGALYNELDRSEDALSSLQQAIMLDPGYVQAYNELGNTYIRLERWDDARRELERGVRLDPSFAPLHKNLGRVALAQRQIDEAIRELQTAIRRKDKTEVEATYWLAQSYAAAGDYAAACGAIARFGELDRGQITEWAPDVADLFQKLTCT